MFLTEARPLILLSSRQICLQFQNCDIEGCKCQNYIKQEPNKTLKPQISFDEGFGQNKRPWSTKFRLQTKEKI